MTDAKFDEHLPPDLRAVSGKYWTPLAVVEQAAEWFRARDIRTVVDLGAGAGKFCVAAALATDATFAGIECRPRLVAAARDLARALKVDARVTFLEATLGECAIPDADAYYLFNPFAELVDPPVQAIHDFLAQRPVGTLALTYHGYGGRMPPGFETVAVEQRFSGDLRLWRKRR